MIGPMVSCSGWGAGLRDENFSVGVRWGRGGFEVAVLSLSGGGGGLRSDDLGGGGRRGRGLDEKASCLSIVPCQKELLQKYKKYINIIYTIIQLRT